MAIFGFGRRRTPDSSKYIVPPEAWDDPKNAEFSRGSAQSLTIPTIFASHTTMCGG